MKLAVIVVALVLGFSACATSRAKSAAVRDPLLITQEEISASQAGDAYEAIFKLRRNFLTSRGVTTLRPNDESTPMVFVDGMEYGPIASLKSIPAVTIGEIRLFRSWEATTLYGTGYMHGVIAVTTRR